MGSVKIGGNKSMGTTGGNKVKIGGNKLKPVVINGGNNNKLVGMNAQYKWH